MTPSISPQQTKLEDPLVYLPCSKILEFRRGHVIYGKDQPAVCLYLIIDGKVKLCRMAANEQEVMMDIYQADEFFGESALLGAAEPMEWSIALETTKVMMWTATEIEELCDRRPKLALALLQLLAQRCSACSERIESFSVDSIAPRLARSLLRFSERFGNQTEDGLTHMIPFTHEVLAQYVGTSREIVTHYMNNFRRDGYLQYSRRGISVRRDALKEWLSVGANVSPASPFTSVQ